MFFNANELHTAVISSIPGSNLHWLRRYNKKQLAKFLSAVKEGIIARQQELIVGTCLPADRSTPYHIYISKFWRPWHVVPSLRNFRPPQGEYGVGIEVEMGFTSQSIVTNLIRRIRNWRYIAVDLEGGLHGAEVTFPPQLYSKFSSRSQPCRYLKLLSSLPSGSVCRHTPGDIVGTHVNVSYGGAINNARVERVGYALRDMTREQWMRYFGRQPYGWGRVENANGNRFIEWKLFNSVTNWKVLRRYVDVAVALTSVVVGNAPITDQSVVEACEAGYNKHGEV